MHVPNRRRLVPALASALIALAASAHADINGFGNFTLNGTNPSVTGNTLQITSQEQYFEANSAFDANKQSIDAFDAHFTFQLGPTTGDRTTDGFSPADGFAFVLQNNSATTVGDSGGFLGADFGNSTALAFNIFGQKTVGTTVYSGGVTGGNDYNTTGDVDLASGHIIDVTLSYQHDVLTEILTDTATDKIFTTTYATDIASSVGGPNAYVGFTGGTGGGTSDQFIRDFSFTPQAVPEVSTVVTFALLVVGGLIVLRRRSTQS